MTNLTVVSQLVYQLVAITGSGIHNTTSGCTTLPEQTMILPDGFTAFPDIGVAYKYFNIRATWNVARKTCMAYGSNLAVVDSIEKVRAVNSIRLNNAYGVHIGIHRLFGDNEWLSVKTGLPVASISWAPDADENNMTKNCLSVRSNKSGITAKSCGSTSHNFVCEVSLLNVN